MNRGYTLLWRKTWANPLLCEPGRKFSRLEAWLHVTNVLATGVDDPDARLRRGEFRASIRRLAGAWNWSPAAVFRFLRLLAENRMISRVKHQAEHPAEQEAERFTVCNYETYNPRRNAHRNTRRNTYKEVIKEGLKEVEKDTHVPAAAGATVSPDILLDIYRQNNQALPEVKALTVERLKKCRSRIDQAVRDGCLEQYLADFSAAVKKAQQTPFLRGEGSRAWRASFDWFIANHSNICGVLEGKYDGSASGPGPQSGNGNGGRNGTDSDYFDRDPGETSSRRTSRGDPIYPPRQ